VHDLFPNRLQQPPHPPLGLLPKPRRARVSGFSIAHHKEVGGHLTPPASFPGSIGPRPRGRCQRALEASSCCPIVDGVKEANGRMTTMREPLSEEETEVANEMVRGSRMVEVPGAYNNPEKSGSIPEPMTLHEPRLMSEYITAPCKHKCIVIKQVRHANQAHKYILALNPINQSPLRASARQCGLDSSHSHPDIHGHGRS